MWKGPWKIWKICACDVGRSPEAKWSASGASKSRHRWLGVHKSTVARKHQNIRKRRFPLCWVCVAFGSPFLGVPSRLLRIVGDASSASIALRCSNFDPWGSVGMSPRLCAVLVPDERDEHLPRSNQSCVVICLCHVLLIYFALTCCLSHRNWTM